MPIKRKIHKIQVDRKTCIGAATCVVIAPKAFQLDQEGIAIVPDTALEVDDDTLIQAAQSCPVQAIYLFDDQGKKIFG